jgi:hypothetical protein
MEVKLLGPLVAYQSGLPWVARTCRDSTYSCAERWIRVARPDPV